MIMHARGDLSEAMSDARAALASVEFGYGIGSVLPRVILAECLIEQGEPAQARQILEPASPSSPGEAALAAHLGCVRGRLLLLEGRAPEALELFSEVGRVLERHALINPAVLPWRARAARAAHLNGRPAEADALLQESLHLSRLAQAPVPIAHALRVKSEMVRPEKAVGFLLEAVALLDGGPAKLQLAKARLALGRVQRRLGQRANARDHLRSALDLAHRCGATAVETAIQEELRAAGARPRRQAISG